MHDLSLLINIALALGYTEIVRQADSPVPPPERAGLRNPSTNV